MKGKQKPRILLLMSATEQYNFDFLKHKETPYTIINYEGRFKPRELKAFFSNNKDEFDAVAVYSIRAYIRTRKVLEKHFDKTKILIHTIKGTLPEEEEPYDIKVFMNEIFFGKLDKLVEEHFQNL